MARPVPLPWWFDDPRRAELKAKWTPAMEATVRGLVYAEVLAGTHPDNIVAQGEILDEPAVLVIRLRRLRDRLDHWIRHFDPQHQGEDPLPDPVTPAES